MTEEGQGGAEYLVTRMECFTPTLIIGNSYGEQEKVGKNERKVKWQRLRRELETIREI